MSRSHSTAGTIPLLCGRWGPRAPGYSLAVRALLVQSAAVSPWTPHRQWEPPSVSLSTIAGQIDAHDVRVLDMVVWRKRAKHNFLEVLRNLRPKVVGLSAMTFQYDSALRFAYLAKQFDPKIRTVLGGYHASLPRRPVEKIVKTDKRIVKINAQDHVTGSCR